MLALVESTKLPCGGPTESAPRTGCQMKRVPAEAGFPDYFETSVSVRVDV